MLIHDADCACCTRYARWAEQRLPVGIPVVPWQQLPDLDMLGLTETDVRRAAWWVDTDGTTHRGHAAIARSVVAMRRWWSPLAWLLLIPPLSWLAACLYPFCERAWPLWGPFRFTERAQLRAKMRRT
ncbi:MAG: hypothetical protein JJLCMIEE_00859 [Acidimicrobiales bacterium]|nr:hypothetical protein [Acidimicrobiales bacterium]